MRKIYLIRHAQPRFPTEERYCIGHTDLPLSTFGRLQATALSHWLPSEIKELPVFTSPLSRARSTAAFLSPTPQVVNGLIEMHAGEWEGLCFRAIQQRWPEIFRLRGLDQNIPIPGAEDVQQGLDRFLDAIAQCEAQCSGDLVIVAHSTVIQAALAYANGTALNQSRAYKLPLASLSVIAHDEDSFRLIEYGICKQPKLNEALCLSLLKSADCSEDLIAHCRGVSQKATEIATALYAAGYPLSLDTVRFAALLHDIARSEKEHPRLGGDWMQELGYPELSDPIRLHHDHDGMTLDEAAVVFIADKCVQGSRCIPIAERFADSEQRCRDEAARTAHHRRCMAAQNLKETINTICKGEIIP